MIRLLFATSLLLISFSPLNALTTKTYDYAAYKTEALDLKENGICFVSTGKTDGMYSVESNEFRFLILNNDGGLLLNKSIKMDTRSHRGYSITADLTGTYIYIATYYERAAKSQGLNPTGATDVSDVIITRVDLKGNIIQQKYPQMNAGTIMHFFANSSGLHMICTDKSYEWFCYDVKNSCSVKYYFFDAATLTKSELDHDLDGGATNGHNYWKLARHEEEKTTFYRLKLVVTGLKQYEVEFRILNNQGKKIKDHEVNLSAAKGFPYLSNFVTHHRYAGTINGTCNAGHSFRVSGSQGSADYTYARTPDGYGIVVSDPDNSCFWFCGQLTQKEGDNGKSFNVSDGFIISKITNNFNVEFSNEQIGLRASSKINTLVNHLGSLQVFFSPSGKINCLFKEEPFGSFFMTCDKTKDASFIFREIKAGKKRKSLFYTYGAYLPEKGNIIELPEVHEAAKHFSEEVYFATQKKQYYFVNNYKEGKATLFFE